MLLMEKPYLSDTASNEGQYNNHVGTISRMFMNNDWLNFCLGNFTKNLYSHDIVKFSKVHF